MAANEFASASRYRLSTPLSAGAPDMFGSPTTMRPPASAAASDQQPSLAEGPEKPAPPTAQPQQQQHHHHNPVLRYGSLSLLVLQNCSAVLLTRYVQAPHRERFSIPAANLCIEIAKLIMCAVGILAGGIRESNESFGVTSETVADLKEAVVSKTSWQMAVPAGLFTIQNNLLFVALANLDATLFQVSYQLKVLCTAVLMVVMLGKELKPMKWLALFLLFAGIVLTQLKPSKGSGVSTTTAPASNSDNPPSSSSTATTTSPSSSGREESITVGMLAVLTCSMCSAFAGVYFEKVLKSGAPGSSLLARNVQLAIYSFVFNLGAMAFQSMTAPERKLVSVGADAASPGIAIFSFLRGFDGFVWALVFVQAAGGLLIATVIKYADNILKGFATAIAIIVNGIISYIWLSWVPTQMFLLGASVVIGATMLYSV